MKKVHVLWAKIVRALLRIHASYREHAHHHSARTHDKVHLHRCAQICLCYVQLRWQIVMSPLRSPVSVLGKWPCATIGRTNKGKCWWPDNWVTVKDRFCQDLTKIGDKKVQDLHLQYGCQSKNRSSGNNGRTRFLFYSIYCLKSVHPATALWRGDGWTTADSGCARGKMELQCITLGKAKVN